MSKFKKQFKELSGWEIKNHARNEYRERVKDDPMLERGCSGKRISKSEGSG